MPWPARTLTSSSPTAHTPGSVRHDPPRGPGETPAGTVDAARAVLVLHHLDTATMACGVCGTSMPCPTAVDAAEVLASAGLWRAAPFTSPVRASWPSARQDPGPSGRWAWRLARRLRPGPAR